MIEALRRGASSLGVALATGEVTEVADADVCGDFTKTSSVASSSAGIELMHCEVMVLGNAPGSRSKLRATKGVMKDAIDLPALFGCFKASGLPTEGGQLTAAGRAAVVSVLAKADPAASVRGRRTTMVGGAG